MIEYAIRKLLLNDPAVAALVGVRVHYNVAPQPAASPYLVIQKISRTDLARTISGGSSNLIQPRLQLDGYASNYTAAKNIEKAVRRLLDGYRNTVALDGSPTESVRIASCSFDNAIDIYEDEVDPKLHRVSMDYLIIFDEQ
jgi:hypothetical protein